VLAHIDLFEDALRVQCLGRGLDVDQDDAAHLRARAPLVSGAAALARWL
jgi:hypothetical protein